MLSAVSSPSPPRLSRLYSLESYKSTTHSRLKFLYSDFSRQKHSNPASYASNIEWWRQTLEDVVAQGRQSQASQGSKGVDKLILHASGPILAEQFRLEGVGKPLGLATVISELCQLKQLISVAQFRTSTQSIYDPGWLPYRIAAFVVGKPLWWALQQLNIVGSNDTAGYESDAQRWKKVGGDYVVINLVEKAAHAVLHQQQDKAGMSLAASLYSFNSFKREFAACGAGGALLSDLDIRILVKFLERDKQAVVIQGDCIKFVDSAESREITAVDIGVLELKTAVENLESSVEHIQSQIDDRNTKISAALKQQRKEIALSQLRARKQYEELLNKRLNSLGTLHSTLMWVEESAGNVEIMKSYESSTATLRAILAHPSLQRDKIDETMDAMASANADAREIDDTIRANVDMAQADAGIDDAELEAELAALVKEASQEKAAEAEVLAEQERHAKLSQLRAPSSVPELGREMVSPGTPVTSKEAA